MTQEIILTNGTVALVDDEDFERINQYRWTYMTGRGYALRTERMYLSQRYKDDKKRTILMHREIMGFPEGKSVDHRDGCFLNNQKSNLRVCDQINNTQSRRKQKHPSRGEGRSIYKGVRRNIQTQNQRWISFISINKKVSYLGTFDTEIEAAKAYNDAAVKNFGEFAILNLIPE